MQKPTPAEPVCVRTDAMQFFDILAMFGTGAYAVLAGIGSQRDTSKSCDGGAKGPCGRVTPGNGDLMMYSLLAGGASAGFGYSFMHGVEVNEACDALEAGAGPFNPSP